MPSKRGIPPVPAKEIRRILPRKSIRNKGKPTQGHTMRDRKIGTLPDGTLITIEGSKSRPDASLRMKKKAEERRAAGDPYSGAGHLKPYMWKPGQSGHPGGRPKRKSLTQAYLELMNTEAKCALPGYEHMTWPQAVAFAIGVEAVLGGNVGGSVAAAKEIRDATEGPTSGDGGSVPAITVIFGDDDDAEPDDEEEEKQDGGNS